MTKQNILDRLKEVIKRVCPTKEIDYNAVNENSTLKYDLCLDSIEIIMIAIAIEMEFGIEIANYNGETFKTVGNVADYIGGLIQ